MPQKPPADDPTTEQAPPTDVPTEVPGETPSDAPAEKPAVGVTYVHVKTRREVTYAKPHATLEKSKAWKRKDAKPE